MSSAPINAEDTPRPSDESSPAKTSYADVGRQYRTLIDHSPDAIVVHEGREIVFANSAALRLVGAGEPTQLVGHQLEEFVHQDSIPEMHQRIRSLRHPGSISEPTHLVLRRVGGRLIDVEAVSALTEWETRPAYQVVIRDLTAQRSAETAALRAQQRYERVVSVLAEGVVVVDYNGVVELINPAAAAILDLDRGSIPGRYTTDLYPSGVVIDTNRNPLEHEDYPHAIAARTGAAVSFVLGFDRPAESTKWIAGTCQMLDTGVDSAMVISFSDITDERAAIAQLEYQATHDSLTGLPNRAHVVAAIGNAVDDPARTSEFAVLFLDLDNLKAINDSLGHSVGDEVLCITATRLRAAIDAATPVGRVGGDEFVIVLADTDTLDLVVDEVHSALAPPMVQAGWTASITASVGVVSVPAADQRTMDDLLRDADTAMYAAKAAGGNRTRHFSEPGA